ncbi:MAG: aspartate aminotransferase family protein, partial [Steroidobacteraceae bacterium]
KESDTAAFAKFFQRMRAGGVLLPPSQFEAWFVSASHDDAIIEATLAAAAN